MAIIKEQRFYIMSVSWLCNRLYCQYMVLKHEIVMIRLESLFSLFLLYFNVPIIIELYQYEFLSMIVLLLSCMVIYVMFFWRLSMIWKLFSSRSTLCNKDTPLIRTLSASPMTVRIRGVSLYRITVSSISDMGCFNYDPVCKIYRPSPLNKKVEFNSSLNTMNKDSLR